MENKGMGVYPSAWTPLHEVAWGGDIDEAKELIEAGAEVDAQNSDGITPLHWAAWSGNKEIAELLIASGAKVDAQDKDGDTPLHSAAMQDNQDSKEIVRLLMGYPAYLAQIGNGLVC